jgi:hypothetical protein
MLLCDAAQEAGGKLFVLGGGWSIIRTPGIPVPMSLAVKVAVPWDQTNSKHRVQVSLLDEDGEPVTPTGAPGPIGLDGQLEVGRPPGIKAGTPIDAPIVMNFGFLTLDPGGYVWVLSIDELEAARTPFRVMG